MRVNVTETDNQILIGVKHFQYASINYCSDIAGLSVRYAGAN